jgi:hypothetical protein
VLDRLLEGRWGAKVRVRGIVFGCFADSGAKREDFRCQNGAKKVPKATKMKTKGSKWSPKSVKVEAKNAQGSSKERFPGKLRKRIIPGNENGARFGPESI